MSIFPHSLSYCHKINNNIFLLYLQNDTGTNYYKEIPLSEILAVDTAKKGAATDGQHCFEVRTANVDYFVGQDASKVITQSIM